MAPIDLTGYWVSIVSEDWRFRMIAAPKGDFAGVPLNPAGQKIAKEWDPAKDEAAGNQCKAYGAAGLMRLPTRLHITWQDDNTLKIETDARRACCTSEQRKRRAALRPYRVSQRRNGMDPSAVSDISERISILPGAAHSK